MKARATSYGALSSLETVLEEPEIPQVLCCCCNLGPDAPALVLLWLLFLVAIYPVALMEGLVPGMLAIGLATVASVTLLVLSWERGSAWRVFCGLCLAVSAAGFCLGLLVRSGFSRTGVRGYSVLSGAAVTNVLAALLMAFSLLMFSYQLLRILTRRTIVGSSASFHQQHGWGWHPTVAAQMHFGPACGKVADERLEQDEVGGGQSPLQRQVTHRLLRRQCYWSGEPAFDYVFHLANTNMFLSCLLSHPVHPIGKRERLFILFTVCCLIVFPVAAFSVIFGHGLLRACLQLALVTGPRNLLKTYLLQVVIEPDAVIDRSLHGKRRWQEVVREKVLRQKCDRSPSHHWNSRVADTLRNARAQLWETLFCTVCLLATAALCATCSWVIVAHGEPLHLALLNSCDGLVFAHILELILDLVVPSWSVDGAFQLGFFGQWWRERPCYSA